MKLKLDENLEFGLASLATESGCDVTTVSREGISGCSDQSLYDLCAAEQKTLITLDMGFANPLCFPPETTAGIVVLRPPRPSLGLIKSMLRDTLPHFKSGHARGRLWIVEPGIIRIHESRADTPE